MAQNSVGPLPWLPRIAAIAGAIFLLFSGVWAMLSPRSFFDRAATFEPYNQHFIQDIGAFQIGLGAVLALAVWAAWDALTVALVGVGAGAVAHLVSHLIGTDLGGRPERDLPFFTLVALLLLAGGFVRLRQRR